ncbi:universal stress protein [Polaribacter reichenbachii]|uniref:Universal stress protein n=1 Tax=Polaribacter reichenbachii TaxID=996801 RepID=A0A1B8TVK9_9FLAO|nr:universal stress protein [Polaribacter reichenbachii]APZ45470.1 universal stress protein [Polaribacter reichenbachii]AUC19331.1 universal stress protein [Polaribacter reichenbachii]OBY63515.1 universal stress protein [Polaribacter reichenbachii]
MKNILLPTDFSENSWNAIAYAISMHKDEVCNFYLLNVNRINNTITSDIPYTPNSEVIDTIILKPSKQKLRKVVERINKVFTKNKNHKFYTLIDYNYFIDSIRKHVSEKNIDLIVMGTKGASGLKELLIGSNAGEVITKVSCSTLIVPENATYSSIKEIAFPTDFILSYNTSVLNSIINILKKEKASLRILHIVQRGLELSLDQQNNKEVLEDLFSNFKHSFHSLSNSKVEDAIQCFVESRDIDMMAMVAKNLNYFQQILFHSKVEKISYHTNVPFLVLHE